MSRIGDLENAIVARLATALVGGAPAFAVVKGHSGGYRPALSEAIRRERLPAAYVAFSYEPVSPETPDIERGPQFRVLVATRMLRGGDDPRHGDGAAPGAFELMDVVRARLDLHEPNGDVQLQCLFERFVEADDRAAIYEIGYRAWPFFAQVPSGDPLLAGPRVIGSVTDFIRFDPATGSCTLAGAARPTQDLPFFGPAGILSYNAGSVAVATFLTSADAAANVPAVQVAANADGGWRSFPVAISEWCDVDDTAEVIVPVQAVASATGNLSLRASWDRVRAGAGGLSEASVSGVVAGPVAAGDIAYVTIGTLSASTFAPGDVICLAVQRLGATDAADTYSQDILIARCGWLRFRRSRL